MHIRNLTTIKMDTTDDDGPVTKISDVPPLSVVLEAPLTIMVVATLADLVVKVSVA